MAIRLNPAAGGSANYGDIASFVFTQQLTVTLTIDILAVANGLLFSKWLAADRCFFLEIRDGDELSFAGTYGDTWAIKTTSLNLTPGLHRIVVRADMPAGPIGRIWVDGVEYATTVWFTGSPIYFPNNDAALILGTTSETAGVDGVYSNAGLWNVLLSVADCTNISNGTLDPETLTANSWFYARVTSLANPHDIRGPYTCTVTGGSDVGGLTATSIAAIAAWATPAALAMPGAIPATSIAPVASWATAAALASPGAAAALSTAAALTWGVPPATATVIGAVVSTAAIVSWVVPPALAAPGTITATSIAPKLTWLTRFATVQPSVIVLTDRGLLNELQYVLIEPPDGGDTWPSLVWTREEVLDAVNAGARALCRDTHLRVTRTEINVLAGTTAIALPSDWLATAHLVWRGLTGTRTPLGPVDGFEGDLAQPGWETTHGLPLGYADLDGPTLTLRLCPTPNADGTLELLYIALPPLIDPALGGGAVALPLAPEFTSALKYAALGTLLRKVGRLLDDERARYAERRYALTETAATILLGGWA